MLKNSWRNKLIAMILIFTLTFSNFALVGKTYAASILDVFSSNEGDTGSENVEFDANFMLVVESDEEDSSENESEVKITEENIGKDVEADVNVDTLNINLSVKVSNSGYLKDAKIILGNGEEVNFAVDTEDADETTNLQSIEDSTIKLSQMNADSEFELSLPISYNGSSDYVELETISKNNVIRFEGTYVDGEDEITVEKEVTLSLTWQDNRETSVESEITKYITYSSNGEIGVILQMLITASNLTEEEDATLPVKSSTVEIEVPDINGVLPDTATIVANSLVATTSKGIGELTFSEDNYSYDSETNLLTIKVKNESEQVTIQSDELVDEETEEEEIKAYAVGNGTDEYLVTYVYSGVSIDDVTIDSSIISTFNMYGNTKLVAEEEKTYELAETIGNIVTFSMTTDTESISKGYTYLNYNNEDSKYEIEIDNKLVFNVSYSDIVTSLQYEDETNYYTTASGLSYEQIDIYYKSMTIDKDNFDEILGEDGYINLYDENGNLLITINSETEVADSGDYELSFDSSIKWIKIETSAPIANGNLVISCIKAYTDTSFDKETYKTFTGIEINGIGKAGYTYVDELVDCETSRINIDFEETITDSELVIGQDTLSTLAINNGVEIKIELNNDDITSDVYGESEFLIEMPEYVESVEVTDYSIVYGEGLEISEISAYDENGTIYIRIHVIGTQSQLSSGIVSNGTNIILNANIKVDLYATCATQSFKLYYLNSEATNYASMENGYGYSEAEIEYSAPSGVVAVNSISNYNSAGETVTSVKQGTVVGDLDLYGDSHIATMELVIMNNEENDIENISILGRTIFEGNIDILTEEDLGTTLDAVMISGISYDGDEFTIYYSTNETATNDLDDETNGWTTEVEDWSQIKSYLIVPNDSSYILEQAEKISFSYEFYIPGDLAYNEDLYGTFGIYYTNNTSVATLDELEIADLVGLSTGVGPELEAELDLNKTSISEFEEFETTVTVSNVGEVTATNVEVEIPIPEYVSYSMTETDGITVDETASVITYTIDELEVGEEIEITSVFEVEEIADLEENATKTIGVYAITTADELETAIQTETVGVSVSQAELDITIYCAGGTSLSTWKDAEEKFTIVYQNLLDETVTNAIISIYFDESIEFERAYIYDDDYNVIEIGNYDSETRIFTYTIDSIDAGEIDSFIMQLYIGDLDEDEYSKTIELVANIQADNTESYSSNEFAITIEKENLSIVQTTTTETYVEEGDEIVYIFTISNSGLIASEVTLEDIIPDGVTVQKISYTENNELYEIEMVTSNSTYTTVNVDENETVEITITVIADDLDEEVEELEVTNYGIAEGRNMTVTSNTITHIIQASSSEVITDNEESDVDEISLTEEEDYEEDDSDYDDDSNDDDDSDDGSASTIIDSDDTSDSNSTNSDQTSTVSSNSSGDTSSAQTSSSTSSSTSTSSVEKTYKILGIAWLDSNQDGARDSDEELMSGLSVALVDSDSETIIQTTTTDSNGEYAFTDVSNGNYIVMFDYDSSTYALTTYQKEGVSTNVNSDVISSEIDGEQKAITDTIVISGASVSNIDIGLIITKSFDLSLEMGITKITVQNSNGTNTEEYDMSTLTKTEISQRYLAGSEIYIEYTFVITNEGDISGYVTEIVDYIPDGMTFNSSLNTDWYTGTDGNLYTTAFKDTEIVAGETKTFTLILSKTMTDENTGRVSNTAEISDDYNIYGLEDSDSTPGNNDQEEDDFARADAILGVGTGIVVICISTISIILVILAVTLVVLKKRKRLYKGGAR